MAVGVVPAGGRARARAAGRQLAADPAPIAWPPSWACDCELYVKTETSNPTHSFKDRVVAVAAAKSVELGYEALACASTGNLAGATAAAGAALGLPTYIFVPSDLEPEKIIAAAAYGATVFVVDGTYDDVNRLCSELAYDRPWAFVNVNMRAYYAEGSKTIALETAEQLGWRVPDRVVAPIASGSLYTKILQGFEEGRASRAAGRRPGSGHARLPGRRLRAGGDRLRRRLRSGRAGASRPGSPSRSPSAAPPTASTRWRWPGAPAARSRPSTTSRSSRASSLLAATTGVFTETAGGVTAGVLRKLAERGEIGAGETVVVYITGDGLKTIDAVRAGRQRRSRCRADPDEVDAALAAQPAAV